MKFEEFVEDILAQYRHLYEDRMLIANKRADGAFLEEQINRMVKTAEYFGLPTYGARAKFEVLSWKCRREYAEAHQPITIPG